MKKLLSLVLALVMVLSLVACAKTEAPKADAPAADAPAADAPAADAPAADAPAADAAELEAVVLSMNVLDAEKHGKHARNEYVKEKFNLTYVFIGHDLAVIRYISDRILVMYLGKVMEIVPYDQLCGENTHPYTQALVSAIPEPSTAPRTQRILLEGDIPSVVNPPKGCRFCQRCFKSQKICFEQEPEMKKVGEGHYIRCHFAKEAE